MNGFEFVGYSGKYPVFRKVENGRGKWKAQDPETQEFFDITYQQARGEEPIRPTGIENLSRKLGKILLP